MAEKAKTFGKTDIRKFEHIKEKDLDALMDKCLEGNMYSEGRSNACLNLAELCYKVMRENYNFVQRDEYRDKIMEDAGIENREYPEFTKIVAGKEYPSLYGYNSLYDPIAKEDIYIEEKMKHPLGMCDIALFGLEKQFNEQVEGGFFQSKHHANAMKTAEHLVLDEKAELEEVPNVYSIKIHFNKLPSNMRRRIAEYIIGSEDPDPRLTDDIAQKKGFKHIHRDLYPKLLKYYQTNYPDHIDYIPRLFKKSKGADISFESRNDVINPKIQADTYKIGSRANLSKEQRFFMEKKIKIDDGFDVSTWKEIENLSVRVVWEEMKPTVKAQAIKDAIIEARKAGYNDETISQLVQQQIQPPTIDFDGLNKNAQEALRRGIVNNNDIFDDNVINEILVKRPPKYDFIIPKGGELDCWHSFLGFVNYPQTIADEWININNAWKNGDIDEKDAMELIRGLENIERKFLSEAEKQAAIVHNANPDVKEYIPMTEMGTVIFTEANRDGFKKPTTYQPIRLRLYGSQKYVNDIINNFTYDQPLNLATGNNAQTEGVFRHALNTKEFRNLEKNRMDDPSE